MKRLINAIALIVLFTCVSASCERNKADMQAPNTSGMTVTLDDKPLDSLKYYLHGRWQMISREGGFTGKDKAFYTNTFITITPDRFVQTEDGAEKINAPIVWEKAKNIHTGDSTFVMTSPSSLKFNYIRNDSLYADNNYYDGYSYLLVRAK